MIQDIVIAPYLLALPFAVRIDWVAFAFRSGGSYIHSNMLCKHCGEVEPAIRQNSIHLSAYCTQCGAFIKHIPQYETDFKMPFGKYKGMLASEMVKTDLNYARWAHQNMDKLSVRYLSILGNLLP